MCNIYLENDLLPLDNSRAKCLLLSEEVYFLEENKIQYHLDATARKGYKDCNARLVPPNPLRYEVLVCAYGD